MENQQDQTIEAVRLARDLCMGMGAFVVSPRGDVRFELAAPGPAGVGERVTLLARSCLERPGAQGNEPFWNAEILGEDESADDSLACVAVPIRAGAEWSGLLGVVDTWLPELDEEQRLGLLRLTQALGDQLSQGAITLSGPDFYGVNDTIEAEPYPTSPPGIPIVDETEAEATETPMASTETTEPGASSTIQATEPLPSGVGLLDEVVEHIPEGLIVTLDDGTIVFANAAFGDLSGLLPEETLGQDITELLHRNDTTETDSAATLLDVPYPGRHLDLAHVDGEPLSVQVSGARFASRLVGDCHVAILREALTSSSGLGAGHDARRSSSTRSTRASWSATRRAACSSPTARPRRSRAFRSTRSSSANPFPTRPRCAARMGRRSPRPTTR